MDPVTTYLTGLDAPLRETGEKLRTVAEIDPELFTGWLRDAYALETR
ncbi:hypothetical protein [Micromonospora chersina]